jgi:putative aldouronate transport system substrate-binding protein
MMLMNLLISDNGAKPYQTFVYGIEGEHWVDNGDGTITTLTGDGQATADFAYGAWKWTIGTCTHSLVTQTDVPGYYEDRKEKEATAYTPPLLGFKFDNEEVLSIEAQLIAVHGEYQNSLIRGYLGDGWRNRYDEFIAKLKLAGLDEYLEEIQRQVTEFVTANNSKW